MKLLARLDRLRVTAILLLVIGLLGLTVSIRLYGAESWRWLVDHETALRRWLVVDRPWQGWFMGLLVFTLLSLVPGLAGKSLVFAWLYGFWRALPIVNLGLTVAAIVEFVFARWLLRSWVETLYEPYVTRVRSLVEREGPYYLFAARVAHAPYTVTNLLMGVTPLSMRSFWWATQLGLLPGNVVFCYAGTTLPTLAELSQGDFGKVFSLEVWSAVALVAIFPWLARWTFRFWMRRRCPQ